MADVTRLPVGTVAKLLMLDERRIQQLAAEGWIPRDDRGTYRLVESVQGYIRFLKSSSRDSGRLNQHANLAAAQTIKVEIENARRMGELTPTAQAEELLRGLVVTMRSAHEGLAGRLSVELASISEPAAVYRHLQSEFRAVLDLCAHFLDERATALENLPEPGGADAPAGANVAGTMGAAQSHDAA